MAKYLKWLVCSVVVAGACASAPEAPVPPEPEARPESPEPPRPSESVRVGLVISRTGSSLLQQYGELIESGAVIGAEQGTTARRRVELVVRDDGGTAAGAARAVRELEAAGVDVIIGPLTDATVTAAARARSADGPVLVSPLAPLHPTAGRVYSLNVVDTRGAAALGEHARRYERVGVLHSRTAEASRQAQAFVAAYSRGGHGTVRQAPFDSGAVNISTQLTRLRDARVQAVYFPAAARELQVALPQLEHFGLSGVQLLGNESWVSDGARGIPERLLEGAIVATPLWRESDDVAWLDFVQRYEAKYRRSLQNPVPALGYDAVMVALRTLSSGDIDDLRGATGVLSASDDGSAVTRRPFLVRIQAGRLVPVN